MHPHRLLDRGHGNNKYLSYYIHTHTHTEREREREREIRSNRVYIKTHADVFRTGACIPTGFLTGRFEAPTLTSECTLNEFAELCRENTAVTDVSEPRRANMGMEVELRLARVGVAFALRDSSG